MPTPKDHALAVVKAALNLIPVVGGTIASLVGDYVPSSTQKAVERTIELLGEKLGALASLSPRPIFGGCRSGPNAAKPN